MRIMEKIFGISKRKKEVSSQDIPNSHILITGKSGSGKTYAIFNLIVQSVAKAGQQHLLFLKI